MNTCINKNYNLNLENNYNPSNIEISTILNNSNIANYNAKTQLTIFNNISLICYIINSLDFNLKTNQNLILIGINGFIKAIDYCEQHSNLNTLKFYARKYITKEILLYTNNKKNLTS